MSKLQTTLGNITFQSPFILASGPPTGNGEMIARGFEAGWSGAVTKTICLSYGDMIDVSPRITAVDGGLQNIELISPLSPEKWAEDIRSLKQKYPQNIIIASISAEAGNPLGWRKLALMMQDAGADLLELNFSCPHGLPEMGMGNACSDFPELAAHITKAVKEVATIPVWTKLSPNVTSIRRLAKMCFEHKADGISAINTIKGFAGVDIETGLPKLDVNGYSSYGGISGSIIKPFALRAVARIASFVPCPVSGIGGISNWQDAIEFIMLGASTVQLCTEVMFNGYGIINELKQGTEGYLDRHGIASIQDIRGKSLKYIKAHAELDNTSKSTPHISSDKCVQCGKCHVSCSDAGYHAISKTDKGFPVIDAERCAGCGLCSVVCPVSGAIRPPWESLLPE